ncbi:MAG: hypothetical protein QW451_01475 [Candidatus Aenigmatarchaeota archaeon]
MVERKIRLIFEKFGWRVVRAGGSLGEADLVCLKNKKCILVQVKSTRKKALYFYGDLKKTIDGFPFYLIVDFGYGNVRITKPLRKISPTTGTLLQDFLKKNKI